MTCPHCGVTTSSAANFCGNCGRPLEEGVTVAAPSVAPTVAAPTAMAPTRATLASPPAPPGDQRTTGSSGWLSSSDSISHGRFSPGTILDSRYRIIGLLGRGGMGEVYRADDLRLGQPVALKFLPDAVATDPRRLAQFHNEVRTARQIAHPNICRVYDIGDIDGHLFLSMELVAGEDLATSLRRIGRFPEDKALDIARQLCAGLAAAHERGVIHRDLKPANVMLDDAGKVRVMDFGLATVGTVEDIRVGTPSYMAPEQLLGREVTARSDIYALGLVLYELFTGRRAFTATTLNDLVEQHQSGTITPPSAIISALDPAIERAILRCLDADPARRPASALAVSAALPGGDPLAAALAAGETPSPEMVAAAGEGAGLSRRVAFPLFAGIIVGMGILYVLILRAGSLDRLQSEMNADVLAQKARDAVRALGYADRASDEAYGFFWDEALIEHLGAEARSTQRPSPLLFWYRRSQSPMVGLMFHHDLLTPGIVRPDDPPPIEPGMVVVTLDYRGLLTGFEAIPPQVEDATVETKAPDWGPLFALAGLDASTLHSASPQWNWLASPDTRAAWTGTWPGSNRPLRVEAAALHGHPVAFQVSGAWTRPPRATDPGTGGETIGVLILFGLALAVLIGGAVLARKNLREGRGDGAGAATFGVSVTVALWALWLCQVHVSITTGLLGPFLIAVVTTTFYGVLFWAIYLALEPFVRRYWPQTLVSWTTLLSARVRDPIVGRDMLIGCLLGVVVALWVKGSMLLSESPFWPSTELLVGTREVIGMVIQVGIYAIRTGLFFFFLLFLLRVLLRNQWAAAIAFAALFAALDGLTSTSPLLNATISFVYCIILAVAVVRWGLTAVAVGMLVANLLINLPATADFSAWYAGTIVGVAVIPIAIAAWALYTSLSGRIPSPALP
jgi:serine/threonine-protein kinase